MPSQRKKTKLNSIGKLINEYLSYLKIIGLSEGTISQRKSGLNKFLEFCNTEKLNYIDQIEKRIFLKYISKAKKGNSSCKTNSLLSALKNFWKYLLDYDYISRDLTISIKYKKVSRILRVPTPTQVKDFLESADRSNDIGIRDRSILELFYSTGIRRRELINLDIDHIDLMEKHLRVIKGKGKKDRVVPIGECALLWLEKYLKEYRKYFPESEKEKALYLSSSGGRLEYYSIDIIFKTYRKKSGLNNVSAHILRHSCATHMLQGGANIRYIQKLLGHKYLETTQIYTGVLISELHNTHSLYHPRGFMKS